MLSLIRIKVITSKELSITQFLSSHSNRQPTRIHVLPTPNSPEADFQCNQPLSAKKEKEQA